MARLRLAQVGFKAGPAADSPALEIIPPTVLILVGPNNSGKSLALRELENWCNGHEEDRQVLGDLVASYPEDLDDGLDLLRVFEVDPPEGQLRSSERFWVGQHSFGSGGLLHTDSHFQQFENDLRTGNDRRLREQILRMYTVRLDGRTRFALSDPKPTGDLLGLPQNHLWSLFQDEKSRARVRELTEEAFGLSFVVDPTAMRQFRIRMSERPPHDPSEEQSLDERSRRFHSEASLVSELSDGVQAFTGLVSAVMSLPHKVILIDEPEAFLHPPLARRLGRNLSQLAAQRDAHLIVATHSSDFVMGCVEAAVDTSIVRLTFNQGVATARSLSSDRLETMMRHPLLRSTRGLQGLFHRAVVVTEADTDRAFYDEVNSRLVREDRGIADALFVNAQNWQTTADIVGPLRALGVPTSAIIDLDAVVASESWSKIYDALGITDEDREWLKSQRAEAREILKEIPDPGFKRSGLAGLSASKRGKVRRYLSRLEAYGLFVVPVGEVEQWLSSLGVEGKRRWLIRMFERLGSNPEASGYVRPHSRDVWAFLDRIGEWASNPNRLGMWRTDD